jgi:hypothetical protein
MNRGARSHSTAVLKKPSRTRRIARTVFIGEQHRLQAGENALLGPYAKVGFGGDVSVFPSLEMYASLNSRIAAPIFKEGIGPGSWWVSLLSGHRRSVANSVILTP